jgi:hypothetical protein
MVRGHNEEKTMERTFTRSEGIPHRLNREITYYDHFYVAKIDTEAMTLTLLHLDHGTPSPEVVSHLADDKATIVVLAGFTGAGGWRETDGDRHPGLAMANYYLQQAAWLTRSPGRSTGPQAVRLAVRRMIGIQPLPPLYAPGGVVLPRTDRGVECHGFIAMGPRGGKTWVMIRRLSKSTTARTGQTHRVW